MSRLLDNLLVFGRVLRRAGIDVHPGRLLDVVEALGHVNLGARDEVYHTLPRAARPSPGADRRSSISRSTRSGASITTASRGHRAAARRASASVGRRRLATDDRRRTGRRRSDSTAESDDADADARRRTPSRPGATAAVWPARTSPRSPRPNSPKRARALARLVWNPGERRTRRWVRGRGARIDLRRAIAESLRTGGDIVTLAAAGAARAAAPARAAVRRQRLDGALLPHAAALRARVDQRHQRVEAFLFSTRLTRITRSSAGRGPTMRSRAVSRAVPDWSGGTRIGAAVKEFHQRWSRRVLHGGPVVLLISDGWDRGDPGGAPRSDRAAPAKLPSPDLAEPADRHRRLRAADARPPGGAAVRGRFLPARTLTNLADLAVHLNALA